MGLQILWSCFLGVVNILWCRWFKNITDVDYLTYLNVFNSFQCYNKIRLCILWFVLLFLLRSLAFLRLSADVLNRATKRKTLDNTIVLP